MNVWYIYPLTQHCYLSSLADTLSYLTALITVPCQALWEPEAKGKLNNTDSIFI